MVHTAADVLRVNSAAFAQHVQLIPRLSLDLTRAEVPELVSLLVTETFDAGLLGDVSVYICRTRGKVSFSCPGTSGAP
jgi:hypothetical protein